MPLTILLAAAAVAPSPPMTPVGPWQVRAEENLCLLQRDYTAGPEKVSLLFQPLLDLDTMELFVITADRSDKQYVGSFTVATGPSAEPYEGKYFSIYAPARKVRVTRLSIDRAALDRIKDGDVLTIKAKPVNRSFTVVRPEKARIALRDCVDDLKRSWGIDPEMKDRTATPLEGDPARFFSYSDYPAEAVNKGIYGRVVALLNVDQGGAVTHCRIVSSAGSELNAGTCKQAVRIRFKPARDIDGKPLPSTYILPVRWVLPGAPG